MNKKKAILIAILILFVASITIWYVFYVEKDGKIEIMQEGQKMEEKLEEQMVFEAPQDEIIENEEVEETPPEQIIEEFKQSVQKPVESNIKTDEIVKEPAKENNTSSLNIKNNLVSFGFQKYSGERKIDTIILHSSFNSLGGDQYDVNAIIDIYKSYGVSAHYIIARDGTVYRLVRENDISYHAGVSVVPDGRTNVNNFSIGIEIVANYNDGYTQNQYDAVNALINDIKSRYDIKYVLGHDDIAPDRKTDPWKFDFKRIE